MMYNYNLQIPLVYNNHEIYNTKSEFDFFFRLEDAVNTVIEDTISKDKIQISLSNSEEKNVLMCNLAGITAEDDRKATKKANDILYKLSRGLTIVINKTNSNKHIFHPRVEAAWEKANLSCSAIETKQVEILNAEGRIEKIPQINVIIPIRTSVNISFETNIPINQNEIELWEKEDDLDLQFLFDEYYNSMGSENIKSKFFHLYSIIEFCEQEFEKDNQSQKLLSKHEIEDACNSIENVIAKEKRDKVNNAVKNILNKITDINREKKILNILQKMNIVDYSYLGETCQITESLLRDFTKLRGMSYHGARESGKDNEAKYKEAVAKLIDIDEKIIDYILKEKKKRVST